MALTHIIVPDEIVASPDSVPVKPGAIAATASLGTVG
jgi:hypothetical protein